MIVLGVRSMKGNGKHDAALQIQMRFLCPHFHTFAWRIERARNHHHPERTHPENRDVIRFHTQGNQTAQGGPARCASSM
jgi:hypothetical protein